jgi:uncharacterized membrane protein YkvA (DUF1232 family)
VLHLAIRHPRTPWYAKVVAACVVAYALSPIDLIPDPIPVLGYLDDLILVPLGVLLVRKLIPAAVLDECREQATTEATTRSPLGWAGAAVIGLIWQGRSSGSGSGPGGGGTDSNRRTSNMP